MQVGGGSVRTVYQAPPNHHVWSPTWSPDGEYLVFEEADDLFPFGDPRDVFKVLHLGTGNVVTLDLGTGVTQRLSGPDWAKTKPAIAFGAYPSQGNQAAYIHVVDLEPDGNGNWQTAGPPVLLAQGVFPSWSSDDSKIVYSKDNRIGIYDLATGRTKRLGAGRLPDWRR